MKIEQVGPVGAVITGIDLRDSKEISASKIKNNILNKINYYGKKSESLKKTVLFIFEREK